MEDLVVTNYKCSLCGVEIRKLIKPSRLTVNGYHKGRKLCMECDRTFQKEIRGRNAEEMRVLELKNMPPVKVFNRAEIEAVAHTITPPVRTPRGRYFRI